MMNTKFVPKELKALEKQYNTLEGQQSNLFEVIEKGVDAIAPNEIRTAEYRYIIPKSRNLPAVIKIYTDARSAMATGKNFHEALAKMFHLLDENSKEGAFYRDAIVVAFEELKLPPVGQRHGLKETDEGIHPRR
jgi:hypothetical protein